MFTAEHKAALEKISPSPAGKPHDPEAMLKPMPIIGKVLVARMISMTPEQKSAIQNLITPDNADALKVLLPELSNVIDKGATNGAAAG